MSPWQTPAAGEFWALTLGDVTVVARADGTAYEVVQDRAPHIIAADAPFITHAERIWPKADRKEIAA